MLAASDRCDFTHFIDRLDFENLETTRDPSPSYLDLGSAMWHLDHTDWPSCDTGFSDRTFRYALTQFQADAAGRCQSLPDADGFVEVTDAVTELRIRATVWDQNENSTQVDEVFRRDEVEPPTQPEGALMINEVLADPAPDFDANQDGQYSSRTDEFVELVNASDHAIDLSGFTIWDGWGMRAELVDAIVEPGQAVVIFAGTAPHIADVVTLSAGGALGLNNTGDELRLLDATGALVDSMSYGREGGANVSLVRQTEADPDSEFVAHSGSPASPGFRSDGSSFR